MNLSGTDIKYLTTEYTEEDKKILARIPESHRKLIEIIQKYLAYLADTEPSFDLDEQTEEISQFIYTMI